MKKLRLSLIVLFLIAPYVMAQPGDAIVGKYHLPNYLDIEIFESDGKYLGKIIGLDGFNDGQKKDIYNPDKSNQEELLLGKIIIDDLEFEASKNQWVNGRMYGPEKGLIFNLKITAVSPDEIKVVASKYLFWKTLSWEKI
ncbi:MAG: DUF2147 domain-containing protein [Candidatus Marinimicrobia bacterium]|nr:DUF2147 domain-containing protein [Candidatus Neomarinimicrobiota bacterium]